jgi:hypothetical protein
MITLNKIILDCIANKTFKGLSFDLILSERERLYTLPYSPERQEVIRQVKDLHKAYINHKQAIKNSRKRVEPIFHQSSAEEQFEEIFDVE